MDLTEWIYRFRILTRTDLTLPQYLTLPQLRVFLGEPYLPTDARKPEARET